MRIDNYRIVGAIRFLSSITVACLFVAPCLGETTFQLVNYAPEVGLDAPIFDGSGIALAGDTYVAELYGGKWASSLTPAYYAIATNRVRVPFLTGSGAGYFNTYQGVGIRDTVGGESVWLQIRVWNTRLGATYEEVATRGLGGFGESNLFYARGGGGSNIPEPPASLIGLQSFKLRPLTPALLMRSLRRQGNQIAIQWNSGFLRYQLQQSVSLDQPWQNVGDPTTLTTASLPVGGPFAFFRVIGFLE